jgi:hypothetical protein
MQSGWGRSGASAQPVGIDRRCGRLGILLLGLTLSACVNRGQIGNLTEAGRATVAFESVGGPPPAVVHKFMKSLEEEAAARRIAVVAPRAADYRLRAYLATHNDGAATSITSITWALDVYGADQHRAIRLSGEETAAGRAWAAADDEVLHRIANAGMERFAAFLAAARPRSGPAVGALPAPPQATAVGWLDDWTPEAAGIFRILRGEPTRTEIAADAGGPVQPDGVPLPRNRPAAGARSGTAFAFARED